MDQHRIEDGFIVGGIAEKGFSTNDIDIITDAELPAPFHVITDSEKPQGPAIDVKKLATVRRFLTSFKFMKPAKTPTESHEYYDIKDFKDFKGEYAIEPKYDGIRVAAAKIGPGIIIRTDEGRSIEDKLPNIAEELRKMPYDTAVLDCELVVYIRGKRGDHSDVTAYLNSKSPAEDYHVKLKPFDVVYADGVDQRTNPLKDRKKLLAKVSWTDHVHPIKYTTARDGGIVSAIMDQATDEGAMVKDMGSTYNTQGKGWYKWKRQLTIDAKVTAVEKKEGGYIHTCEAGGGVIGKTYVTKIAAKVGDIITVSVDHITKKESGGFTWYAPKVTALRKDKSKPDTAAVLEKMAAEAGKGKEKETEGKGMKTNTGDSAGNLTYEEETEQINENKKTAKYPHKFKKAKWTYPNGHPRCLICGQEEPASGICEKPKGANDSSTAAGAVADAGEDGGGEQGKAAQTPPAQGKPVLEGDFVLHEHWWGDKHHFDLRFKKVNTEGKAVMIGFTLFANSVDELKSRLAEGGKLLAKEKEYHTPEWLTFEGEIKPGDAGNPTKNLTAYIRVRDKGHYSFARREADFVDMTLGGKILNGRYFARKVALKDGDDQNDAPKPGDKQPAGQASEISKDPANKWLFWKAKEGEGEGAGSSAKAKDDSIVFADSTDIQIDASKLADTKEGLLIKDAVICRAMVLDYQGKKVLKPPDELTKSMATVHRIVVTNEHPSSRVVINPVDIKGRILPETVRIENNAAIGNFLITDKALAEEVRNGKRDLSPGYYADVIDDTGVFNNEPYVAVQRNILYDHLAVVRRGRCARPICGILDSADIEDGDLTDSIEKSMGKLHQVAAGLSEKNRELVGRFIESIDSLLLIIHRINSILKELPDDKRDNMKRIVKSVTKSMAAMTDSYSSIFDETKVKETKETMAESIEVDGVGYTPETVKKLVADSAALSEAQKKATELKAQLDAKEAELGEKGTALTASEAKVTELQAKIDSIEQERRTPLVKQIVDAIPALKEEDLKSWDMKRLTDTAASIPEASRLGMKTDSGSVKSIIDEAYAKVGDR